MNAFFLYVQIVNAFFLVCSDCESLSTPPLVISDCEAPLPPPPPFQTVNAFFSCMFRLWMLFYLYVHTVNAFFSGMFRLWKPFFWYVQNVNAYSCMFKLWTPFSCMFRLWTPFLCMHVQTENAFFHRHDECFPRLSSSFTCFCCWCLSWPVSV